MIQDASHLADAINGAIHDFMEHYQPLIEKLEKYNDQLMNLLAQFKKAISK